MDNKNNVQELEFYQDQIKDSFKKWVTADFYDKWADAFEIHSVDKKQVVIAYSGDESIKTFKKECKMSLSFSIYSIVGEGKKIKICKKNKLRTTLPPKEKKNKLREALPPKAKKNITAIKFFVCGMFFVCLATAIIIIMFNYIGNRNFRESFYSTSSIKIDSNVRVIQLSDLHGASYGKNNKKLLDRIQALSPDIIICTGDIVDSAKEDIDYAKNLSQKLSEIAPSYYIYGNNEAETIYDFALNKTELDEKFGYNDFIRDETALLSIKDTFEETLEDVGIKVLKNEKATIKVRSMTIDIYGVLTSNPSSFWSYSEKSFGNYIYENTSNLKITAVHEPFIFEEFQPESWGDLMLCGHTHGGLIRVPLLGPLFTKEEGLFPERSGKYVYGRYDAAGRPLIVSSGLENSNILRINNQPELVIIDINKF